MFQQLGRVRIRHLAILAAAVGMLVGVSWWLQAQDTAPPGYQAYPLKQTQAADVNLQLQKLLAETGVQPEILVDRQANRILIRGPEATQRLAAQLLVTLDRPAKPETASDNSSSPTVGRGYPVPSGSLEATVERLRKSFPPASGVRIAPDRRSGQLIVVATEEAHQRIAQALLSAAPTAVGIENAPVSLPRQNGHQLKHISWREFEDALTRIWGKRIAVVAERNGEVATINAAGSTGPQVVLQVDRRRDWISFSGPPNVAQAWGRVVQSLDQPRAADGQDTDLVVVNRADPDQVERAIGLLASGQQSAGKQGGKQAANLISLVFQPKAETAPGGPPTPPPAAGTPPPATEPPPVPKAGAEQARTPDGPPAGKDLNPLTEEIDGGQIGPVQIEYVDGLDAFILRGGKKDVDRVRRLIEDIERLSADTKPVVEIVPLRYIGSQVLETLVLQVYQEILSSRQGRVVIRSLGKPNALLLIGRSEGVDTIKQLILKLDQPVEPEVQFEVLQLRHIAAADAEQTIRSFFVERLGDTTTGVGGVGGVGGGGIGGAGGVGTAATGPPRTGLGTRVNVVSVFRNNVLIVQASPRDLAEVRRLLAEIDVETTSAANELRIFRLKNALASDVAPVLQDALNWQLIGNRNPVGATASGGFGQGGGGIGLGGGQQQQERARIRSAALTFMTIDSEGGKILESGLLSEVRVSADVNGNQLVITGPAKSMGLIEALVKELDRLPNAKAQIKVFTIVNGDATTLQTMLSSLLGQTAQTSTPGQSLFGQGAINPFLQPSLQSAASMGESSLVPIRFGVDKRSNSIIASGSEGDLGVVEAVLLRLDEDTLHKHKTTVYWLANVKAVDVSAALNLWLTQRISQYNTQMNLSPENPEVRYAQTVIVVPEAFSNSVIVSAVPSLFEELRKVIEAIDRRPPMIKIDVLIAEITLTDKFEFGTEFGVQDSLLYSRTGTTAGAGQTGFNFNNSPLGNLVGNGVPGNLTTQGLSNFNVGRTSALGYGGLVLSASNDAVSALLRALQEKGRIQILSRPQITTLDSQAGNIQVGAIVARYGGSSVASSGISNPTVTDKETGVILTVVPRVTADGLIVMTFDVQKSKLNPVEGVQIPSGTGAPSVLSPNIDTTKASTVISARSGQTVVFAGLIETERSRTQRGIPYLSEIPLVGPLFRFTTRADTRKELLIVMTPHVIRSDDEVDLIRTAETERMSWCLSDVTEVYGNVGFSARPGCWCGSGKPGCRCHVATPLVFPDENPSGLEPVPTPASAGTPDLVPTPQTGDGLPLSQPVADPPQARNLRSPIQLPGARGGVSAHATGALEGSQWSPTPYPGTPAVYTGSSPATQAMYGGPSASPPPNPALRRLPTGEDAASGMMR
ncbi:MAG: hypothetical protein NTY19_11815 [Planctomycetota bacterium]|nr:hypothetical protein [Planctomycetota bacterium]